MAFPGFDVLTDIAGVLIPETFGKLTNKTGLQKAHVIGDSFWVKQLGFLDSLGISGGTDNIFNVAFLTKPVEASYQYNHSNSAPQV